jgi:hypothetical protein
VTTRRALLQGKRQIGGAYQKLLLFTMINSSHSKEELFYGCRSQGNPVKSMEKHYNAGV